MLIGIGFQVFCLTWLFLITVTVATLNVFFRPILFILAFVYSALTAWVNGFATAKVMKFFGATEWFFAAFCSAICFPVYLVSMLVTVDIIEYVKKSSVSTPPVTVLVLGVLWGFIAIPLSF